MEIVGIGTDIVECLRVGRMVERHGELFLTRVYTEREVRYCQGRRRPTEQFAARWAAKEAVFRALGTPWRRGMVWTDVEVLTGPGERTTIQLAGAARETALTLGVGRVLVSLAACRAYAVAHAVGVRGPHPHAP